MTTPMTTATEQRLIAAEAKADRAEKASTTTINTLLVLEREVKAIRSIVTVGFVDLREQILKLKSSPARREMVSLSEDDFEETDAGQHFKITKKVTRAEVDRILSSREIAEDAKRWRQLWRRLRWLFFLLIGGGATFGGERLFEYLAKHL